MSELTSFAKIVNVYLVAVYNALIRNLIICCHRALLEMYQYVQYSVLNIIE